MPLSVTDHLAISPADFDRSGAYDTILDLDSELYIDPFLLRRVKIPELSRSHQRLCEYFTEVQQLLKTSKREGDGSWQRATSMLQLGEAKWVCIGVASGGTSGSGIGPHLANELARTIQTFAQWHFEEPDLFEILPFVQDGLGKDRWSDWVATVILEDLMDYSERVFRELGVNHGDFRFRGKRYTLPQNPFNQHPIVLVPQEILRPLPTILEWKDDEGVSARTPELRRAFALTVDPSKSSESFVRWKDLTKAPSDRRLSLFSNFPELAGRLLEAYRLRRAEPYDFIRDPRGVKRWHRELGSFIQTRRLKVDSQHANLSLRRFTQFISQEFCLFVENQATRNLFYDGNKLLSVALPVRIFWGLWDKHNEQFGRRYHRPQLLNRGLSLAASWGSRQERVEVRIGRLNDDVIVHDVKALLSQLKGTRPNWQLFIVVLETDGAKNQTLLALQQVIAEHQGPEPWIHLVKANATSVQFHKRKSATLPAPALPEVVEVVHTVPAAQPKVPDSSAPFKMPCALCEQPLSIKGLFLHLRLSHKVQANTVIHEACWKTGPVQGSDDVTNLIQCPDCTSSISEEDWYSHFKSHSDSRSFERVLDYVRSDLFKSRYWKPRETRQAAKRQRVPLEPRPKAIPAKAKTVTSPPPRRFPHTHDELRDLAGRLVIDTPDELKELRTRKQKEGTTFKALGTALVIAHVVSEREKNTRLSEGEKVELVHWIESVLQ